VGNHYGTSEAVGLTFECAAQQLHVNSDWYVLEPVDEHDRPVPPGRLSHGALVTNLANRIQPIIRYQLGDQISVRPETCSCASPFPVIDVIGRTDDVLVFAKPGGGSVRILPLAIATVAEETPGVAACQLVQRGPSRLVVRFRAVDPDENAEVWGRLRMRLDNFLTNQGAIGVSIQMDCLPPQLHPRSGKFRQVFADYGPSDRGAGGVKTV
jgi:phenylacetate-coenzyme A ligase PaaK-like adenylate-forming protein